MRVLDGGAGPSVRMKLAVLLVAASLLPLGLLASYDFSSSRRQFMASTEALLAARADELTRVPVFSGEGQRGRLGKNFNAMVYQPEAHAAAAASGRQELEQK